MKSPFVTELEPNQLVTALFLVQHKDVRQKKSGEPYLSMVLGDRSGDVDAKMWDNVAEVLDTFERDDFVRIKGLLQVYQNRPQLTVHKLMRVEDREVDFADFFPASKRDPNDMFAELQAMIAGFTNPHLKALLDTLFADEEIARRYRTAPAAKGIHHAWLGGLIEHVLSLCYLARAAAAHYEGLDLDLLLTGCVVHDVGKIYELNYERAFSYSSDGQLLGHMLMGIRLLGDKFAAVPGFPPRLRNLIEHMILSHHGELEFGSPKLPMFPEALLLHLLDNLDSKMESMRATIDKDRMVDGCWTCYNQALDRTILKKSRYLDESSQEPAGQPDASAEPERTAAAAARPAETRLPPRAPQTSPFAQKLASALKKD